ncbi:hypothetical protein EYF80_016472 [Liparis tanakae]|uniref:Uncharacterized protein n=1 Tax=Liparis tanakae TaxID=230148 RepID=A0A4Z2I5I1_9TELE|nr:hypothetical protein EYF80_016472 [Liparis tanakae]
MPVFSAMGRILLMKENGSLNSSQLGSKTGHSGGGLNSSGRGWLIVFGPSRWKLVLDGSHEEESPCYEHLLLHNREALLQLMSCTKNVVKQAPNRPEPSSALILDQCHVCTDKPLRMLPTQKSSCPSSRLLFLLRFLGIDHFSRSTQTPASHRCVAIEVTTSQESMTGS